MKPEDKELLFKDLCGRLPYSPICHIVGENGADIDDILTTSTINNLDGWVVKPYLRPMSSMTTNEEYEYHQIRKRNSDKSLSLIDYGDHLQQLLFPIIVATESIDWLNKKMFDYRGLIPKGLAIEVTEENNPYKN